MRLAFIMFTIFLGLFCLFVIVLAGAPTIYDQLRLNGVNEIEANYLMDLPQDMWDIINVEDVLIPAGSRVFLVTRDGRTAIEFLFPDTIWGRKHLDLLSIEPGTRKER